MGSRIHEGQQVLARGLSLAGEPLTWLPGSWPFAADILARSARKHGTNNRQRGPTEGGKLLAVVRVAAELRELPAKRAEWIVGPTSGPTGSTTSRGPGVRVALLR